MLEVRRKIVHATGILNIFFILYFGKWIGALILLLITLALLFLGEYRKNRNKYKIIKIKKLDEFENFMENGFKEYERPNTLPFKGAIEFYLGCFLAALLFEPFIAITSIAVVSIADAMSTLIGNFYGKHKISFNKKKSIEGSIAFFLTTILILVFFINDPLKILIISIVATFAEAFPKIDDNLTIPLAVGLLMLLLR
jgi:dolichol kinase